MASRAGRRRARAEHRRLRAETPVGGARGSEERGGTRYVVQQVTGSAAVKDYRCPGCGQLVAAGTAHLVTWPDDPYRPGEGAAERRHWHTPCWRRGLG